MAEAAEKEVASVGIWIGLCVISAISFYCQAVVTEERFVPALNVLVVEFNIPDDVAGATLMAAGASSPELFSSIISLFVTHSALGLGTIVGSEIFNQLVICAGAVFAARSGQLKLDAAIVTREVGFYALSIACLLYALRDKGPTDDDELGVDHIFISFSDALVVALPFILYIIVCAYFEQIVTFCTWKKSDEKKGLGEDYKAANARRLYGSFRMPENMPYAHKTFQSEPLTNFEEKEKTVGEGSARGSFLTQTFHLRGNSESFGSLRLFGVEIQIEKPSDVHALYDLQINTYEETLSCFLWQRSFFYTKAKFSQHGWHLRWFNFTHDSVSSVPDKADYEKHKMLYPRFTCIEIDDGRQMLKIPNPVEGKRDYYFLAPSREIFDAVVLKFESIMDIREQEDAMKSMPLDKLLDAVNEAGDPDEETSLIEFPWAGSFLKIACHCILFPFKALMHYTIPDVRHLNAEGSPENGLGTVTLAILMCLVWLVVGSYAMVASLEGLAALMNIPDAVIGVTVSAAGTSLPNYVASKVAAQQGLGNMAVSNAFGSNTFNIMVGLGWPWVLYIAFANNFAPYHGLRNEGILESVIILASVLLVFIIIMLKDNFTLYRWHGALFIILYVAYLAFVIGQVYL